MELNTNEHDPTLRQYDEAFLKYVNLSLIAAHTIFILITLGTLLLWFFRHRLQNWDQKRIMTAVKYSGETRTLFILTILVVHIFVEASVLLMSFRSSNWNWIIHAAQAAAICGTASCIAICAVSLEAISIVYHCVILLYWSCCSALEILRLTQYVMVTQLQFANSDVRIMFSSFLIVLYVALVVLEVVVLLYKKFSCCYIKNKRPKDDISLIRYTHSYSVFLSKLSLSWLSALLRTGYRRYLCLEDLGQIVQRESTSFNFEKLKLIIQNEKNKSFVKNRPVSLWRCLWHMSKSMMLLSGACKLLSDVLVYVPPICLDVIVSYAVSESLHSQQNASQSSFNSSSVTENIGVLYISVQQFFTNGYVATLVCFLASLVLFLNAQHNYFISVREGIRCKCALQAAVYDKCLRLNVTSLNEGQIMNHVTVDVGRIVLFFNFAHYIWALPFEIIFGFLVLYAQLGVSALISGLIILLVVPLQYYLGLRLAAYQKLIMEQADERLLKSAELLQNIKLLKLYSWETLFYGFVDSIRKKELHFMYKAALVRMLSITFTDGVPFLACLVAFTLYYRLESEPLQPAKVFSSVALFANFATQLFIITLVINTASQARVSVIRLQEFLLLPELTKLHSSVAAKKRRSSETNGGQSPVVFSSDTAVLDEEKQPLQESSFVINPFHSSTAAASWDNTEMGDGLAVEITNGNFAWKTERILADINIKIPRNQLTIVVGSIGSGKSSLIMAMLGEMEQSSGSVKTCSRSVAVVPQSCWVLNATVRENIIFGQPYNKERYEQVIEAASLEQDFKSFVNDDQTEIGEKGANLSGGQRQRIAIARALYADADIYYLDDSLSALDAHVGSHVFNNAIMKLLIKDRCKTVILVTHHTHLLPQADHLIVMKQGHIAYDGSIKHLMAEDPKLYESLTPIIFDNTHTASVSPVYCHAENTSLLQNSVQDFFDVTKLNHVAAPVTPSMSVTSLTSISHVFSSHLSQVDSKKGDDFDLGKLIEEEEMSSGSVPARIFIEFIKAAVWVTVVVTLSLYAMCQALHMTADYFLTEMVNCGTEIKFAEKSNDTVMVEHYWAQYSSLMRIFISLSIVCILLVPISSFCLQLSCLTAAKNLHNKTLRSIVAAPIQFFDRTPIGRILNRLSADMNRIDEILVSCIEALIFCTFYVLGGIVMNSVFVPYFIAPVIPLLVIFVVIQRYFIASSRELQRLDCVTRSPMMALLSQTLGGLSTIRAFRNEAQFQQKIWKRIDDNQLPFLFYHTTNIWMGIRLDILGAFIVLAASLASLTSCLYGHIDSGMVGLVIAYAIMISSFINWMMRGVSETEIQFNSVERIIEYSDLESEPYDKTHPASMSLDPDWPANGEIQIKAVSLKYNINQDPVVANLSLHIKPGQKIGICGRTGSGKSSLTMSLFRAVHISEGKILLDGIDITQVPLRTLRSKLSIIPQEPVLFSGTIRFNMDPTGRVCDEKIWSMLEIAQLKELISNLPKKLDTVVRDGGAIFSIGQKQLFCLARALLRESKVLIMDEATASIDIETDRAIQQIVQKACANRTVLMIAHRISTIQNCDVIVVLRNGRLIEEGSPHYLSSKADSAFAKMVADNKL